MSLQSLSSTVGALKPESVSTENLIQPKKSGMDIFLSVVTFGIYALYKSSAEEKTRNELLDLGKAFLQWDPARPDLPLSIEIRGKSYELSDTASNSVRILDTRTGSAKEIDGLSLKDIRTTIFSDLMHHQDFFEAMEQRMARDSSVRVDLHGMRQERANACGDASISMILKYHGQDYAPATNSRPLLEGRYKDEVLETLGKQQLRPQEVQPRHHQSYSCDDIRTGLKNGPLLCTLTGHFVVVYGVNQAQGRVDIYCPLLGERCCSIQDLNEHLDWDDDTLPLIGFQLNKTDTTSPSQGTSLDPDFRPGIIDRLGVQVLKTGYGIGNGWLKTPEAFEKTL
ncbi:papain-like cysteine protease family protein [Castellaniella ginsengisoli]|jgi:hypothetical protein|uniref:Papain-like cysteine protease family protein n=1 Tax=Castellaniella ginsengisoli TaxID=546114 RepID=A0AB39CR12_9BURK